MKCLVGTTLTECGENLPCVYQSKAGTISMKCATGLRPNLTKVECHTLPADDFATNWKCYCKTEGCNHKCEYKNKPEMCADKVIDVGEGETETHKVCDGMCMTKNKTMSPTMKTMETTKMKTKESNQPVVTTTMTKVDTEPNVMDTTSKSSTINAAALHVVYGMVIIIIKHFP